MTDPKEVERLMMKGARLALEWAFAHQRTIINSIDADMRGLSVRIVEEHLASKPVPAPEAGEDCQHCNYHEGHRQTNPACPIHGDAAGTPAPPAVCEAPRMRAFGFAHLDGCDCMDCRPHTS